MVELRSASQTSLEIVAMPRPSRDAAVRRVGDASAQPACLPPWHKKGTFLMKSSCEIENLVHHLVI